MVLFQSSLELSPECNAGKLGHPMVQTMRFNPHSSFRPSATIPNRLNPILGEFQSSLELSPECNAGNLICMRPLWVVSILTRAFARVQHGEGRDRRGWLYGFNPHSSFRPSATSFGGNSRGWSGCFNPHSSFRPSATFMSFLLVFPRMFQSSLELSPECNQHVQGYAWVMECFNPHSSFRPSATWTADPLCPPGCDRFNPHSSFRPSATADRAGGDSGGESFNPHSSFRPSATALVAGCLYGCTRFNPHSSFRPSATWRGYPLRVHSHVSILTRAFARVQLE